MMNLKLSYQNDWEYDKYSVNGKQIKNLKLVSINGKKYAVTSHSVSVPYSDMGHSYSATSTHYFITNEFGGKTDLNTIAHKVTITPLEFDYV